MVAAGSEVIRKAASWKLRMEEGNNEQDGEHNRVLKPCHLCGLIIKIGLTTLSVGTVLGSANNHCYPKISLDGRVIVGEKPTHKYAGADLEPGMEVAASSGTVKATSVIPTEAVFPARIVKWRQGTTSATEAAAYIAFCRRMGGILSSKPTEIDGRGNYSGFSSGRPGGRREAGTTDKIPRTAVRSGIRGKNATFVSGDRSRNYVNIYKRSGSKVHARTTKGSAG